MNETVKLEAISKIDEIQNFFYKELRLTKELMGTPLNHQKKEVLPLCDWNICVVQSFHQ